MSRYLLDCPRPKPALADKSISVSAAGSATTTGTTLTIPSGRGKCIGIGITAATSTIADVDGCTITIAGNGVNILENAPLIEYSTLFAGDRVRYIGVDLPEATNVTHSIVNDQGTAILVYIHFIFDGTQL